VPVVENAVRVEIVTTLNLNTTDLIHNTDRHIVLTHVKDMKGTDLKKGILHILLTDHKRGIPGTLHTDHKNGTITLHKILQSCRLPRLAQLVTNRRKTAKHW
jgi:hypothetical protein